jgi:hypothetical protein
MSCTSLIQILNGCDNNVGGIVEVKINDMSAITSEDRDAATHTVTERVVSDDYVKFEFRRNVGNYTEEAQINMENCSTFWLQTVMLKLFKREASKSKSIQIAAEGQRDLSVMVKCADGSCWDFPYSQLATDTGGSGTAKADGSNYEITFRAESLTKAYEIDPVLYESL